jgi:hypothetical protein
MAVQYKEQSMSADFTLGLRRHYVHVQLSPGYEITPQSLSRLWTALHAFCREHNCQLVLCEGVKPKRQMSAKESYQFGIAMTQDLSVLQVACYWEGYKTDHLTDLFKQVTHLRGVNIEFFSNREEALCWLGVDGGERVAEAATSS